MHHKRLAWILIVLTLAAGCSSIKGPGDRVNQALASDPKPVQSSPTKLDVKDSAASLGLTADQVLNWASFRGGVVGDEPFAGGHVLVWESEPRRLTVQAVLDTESDGWKPTNVTSHLITGADFPLYASYALVNDVADNERKVPLWAFFGKVTDANIKVVQITFPGAPMIRKEVNMNGTWLSVHQGMIHLAPPFEAVVVAFDGQGKEISQQRLILR